MNLPHASSPPVKQPSADKPKKKQPLLLNQAVDFDREAIFIAVPKTGTTSIRDQLTKSGRWLIPNPHLTILQVRDSLYTYFLRKALATNKRFPSDPTQVPSDLEIRQQAAETFEKFFKFGSVRNPWARTLSLYNRREGLKLSKKMDFETFCDRMQFASDTCSHPTRIANQLDWLTDENGNLLVDFVLRLEDHENGVRQIREMTNGRVELKSQRLNSNPNSDAESYRNAYSDASRRRIAELFKRDIEFFGYEF